MVFLVPGRIGGLFLCPLCFGFLVRTLRDSFIYLLYLMGNDVHSFSSQVLAYLRFTFVCLFVLAVTLITF